MSAHAELLEFLEDGERVEGVVFGAFGWGGYLEAKERPVPEHKRGVVLSLDEAAQFMDGWKFHGGHGAPRNYAFCAWTNRRVITVGEYDGETWLTALPRNPIDFMPENIGG